MCFGFASGFALGATLSSLNTQHTFYPNPSSSLARCSAVNSPTTCSFAPPKPNYHEISKLIYAHLDEHYESLGQLELGEEHLTVKENVFSQIGIIDVDGIRNMWRSVVIPDVRPLTRPSPPKGSIGGHDDAGVIFCDIGSGVGNVCMQVLAETGCKKTIGIEVIPSRHRRAQEAFRRAMGLFPDVFFGKQAVFECVDLVDSASILNREGATVLFTHSWMFDDEVMDKLSKVIAETPSVQCVITSRPLNERILAAAAGGDREGKPTRFSVHRLMHFSADWNDHAPFHVYTTHTASGAPKR